MHIIKAFLSVIIACIAAIIVFCLILFVSINVKEYVFGKPKDPVMPMLQVLLALIFATITLIWSFVYITRKTGWWKI